MANQYLAILRKLRANETADKIEALRKDAEAIGYAIVPASQLEALRKAAQGNGGGKGAKAKSRKG